MDQVLRRAEEAKKGDSSPVELVAQRPMLARQLPLQAPQMQAMMNAVLLFFFSGIFLWSFFMQAVITTACGLELPVYEALRY